MFKRKTRGVFEQKKKSNSRSNVRTKIFGNPIDPQSPVPLVIEQCIGEIRKNGLNTQNLFRDLQYEKVVEQTREQIDKGKPLWLSHLKTKGEDAPVKVGAGLIRVFLQELPEPLVTFTLYDSFIKASRDNSEDPLVLLKSIKELIHRLPSGNYILFWNILSLLTEISQHADQNKMDPASLSVDLGISFFHLKEDNSPDIKNINEIVTLMIEEFEFIFNEAQQTKTLAKLNSTEAPSNKPQSASLDFLSPTIFKQPDFDWFPGKELTLSELLKLNELSPTNNDLPGEFVVDPTFLLKSMDLHDKPIVNPVLDLALGNIEIEPSKHGPFYMKLTFDSLHNEEDESEITDSRVQLNNVEDDPYVATEPILFMMRVTDSDDEDFEDAEYDDLSEELDVWDDNSGLPQEDPTEIDYVDNDIETFTPTRKSPLLDLDLQIDTNEEIRSPARSASLAVITNHLEHIVTPRVTSSSGGAKSRKTELQTRVRRASVHLKKTSGSHPLTPHSEGSPLPSPGGRVTEAMQVLQRLHEFIDIMIDDITNLEVGQVRFIKDLFNVIDKHLVIPSVNCEPRPILPQISQALLVRMEKLATQEEDTIEENEQEKEEQKKQSLLEAADISCRIRQTISTTTQHWDEYDPQQIEKLVECVQSVEECVVNILTQEEALEARKREKNNVSIDPRLLKLKGLLDLHVEDLREEFARIREEVVQTHEKHRVQHVTLLLKFCKEINKQMLHQEPAMSLTDEEMAELINYPSDANPDLISDKLAKANQIIIHSMDQWNEELNLFKEETALGEGSKPLSAITHSIISYSQTITNIRNHVTPFYEYFQKALKQAKFRESFDEISHLMHLNFALLSRIKNLMENDKTKFTRGEECIYAARITKMVQEILSDMTKSDWSVPEYKIEQFVTQEAQDPKKIDILKSATIKLLDTLHETLGDFKTHLTKWVNNDEIHSLTLFSKNLKLVSALFTQVYYDCCDKSSQESPEGMSPRKSEKREKLQMTAISLLDQVLQRLEELKSHATADEPPENLYYLAIISKNITTVISDLNNKEQLQKILENPPQKPTARGLKGLSPQKTQQLTVGLVKSFTDTAVRLLSLKQSLQQPNVTEGELLACFHLAHSVLSVMKCVDIK